LTKVWKTSICPNHFDVSDSDVEQNHLFELTFREDGSVLYILGILFLDKTVAEKDFAFDFLVFIVDNWNPLGFSVDDLDARLAAVTLY
jgi:hypothetical protein